MYIELLTLILTAAINVHLLFIIYLNVEASSEEMEEGCNRSKKFMEANPGSMEAEPVSVEDDC